MRGFIITVLAFVLSLFAVLPAVPVQAQAGDLPWMLGQFNALRARNGVGALVINSQLTVSSQQHCDFLANEWQDGIDFHREPNGSTPQSRATAAGYPGRVGENVVGGQLATKEWAFDWWVHSPVHLKNMLEQWQEVGLSVCTGKNGRWYVADFGVQSGGPTLAPPNMDATSMIPRPTHIATRVPTATPTVTYTPSITYTPVASFTPTYTPTSLPPTQTPIVLEISPQPSAQLVSMAISPAPPPAGNPSTQSAGDSSSNGLRSLIPWAILLQITVVGGLATNAVVHRKRR